jgi:DNA-binding response OmpR family regulator
VVDIVVAESDQAEALGIAGWFRRQGFKVSLAGTGRSAIKSATAVDLVILGLNQPDLDGLEVCQRIRARSMVPILAIGSPDRESDLVMGLRSGLDAYVTRPYNPRELVARVNAILRRTRGADESGDEIERGPLRINSMTREVSMRSRQVHLTRKEFDLLHLLASEPDAVLSRRRIMSEVWDDEWAQSSRTLDTHVSSLRSKLGDHSAILTVRGVGFRIGRLRHVDD